MTDLEELFQDAAAFAEQGQPVPADPAGRLGRARAARRRRQWTTAAVAAAAVTAVAVAVVPSFLARGGESLVPADGGSATTAASPTCTYRPTAQDGATPMAFRPTKSGPDVGLPPSTPAAPPAQAVLHTNRGDITLSLRTDAPCTVNSFTHLIRNAYYDDTPCFRLTTEGIYVLQCGDPSGTGSGGPGYAFDDEALEGASYPAGTVAMANSGPSTNGSQFFFVYKDTQLDPHYTVFGQITAGLDVLTEIAAAGSTPAGDGKPNQDVLIGSVTLR